MSNPTQDALEAGKPKWTPGPWRMRECRTAGSGPTKSGGYIRAYAGDRRLCKFEERKGNVSSDEYLANMHLVAAAPDLYEALVAMVSFAKSKVEDNLKHPWFADLNRAEDALSKARGQS